VYDRAKTSQIGVEIAYLLALAFALIIVSALVERRADTQYKALLLNQFQLGENMKFIMPFNVISWIKCDAILAQMKGNRPHWLALFFLVCFSGYSLAATDNTRQPTREILTQNGVILLYHHVSDNTPKSTSISPEMFKQHMAYLKQHHTVLPLAKVVDAIQSKTPLPSNTVVITFDDGYENILKNAHPIMVDMGFPYTIFINPGEIGTNRSQLTWAQVEAMHNDGVTFANHTLDHLHMLDGRVSSNGADSGTNDEAWLKKVWQNVAEAEAIIDSKIGESLKYLAYPFGEFNQKLADKLAQEGYIAFGQHSGAVGPHSNFQALPRFPAAGPYANLTTLKTKLNSIAMPVLSTSFEGEHIPEVNRDTVQGSSDESGVPPITLTIKGDDVRLSQVNCFFSGSPVETNVEGNAVTFSITQALPVGRSRVNCTAPSNSQSGRYYWYSQPFFVADKNGNYPD